jgi:uncharacterized Tic20 family protein
MSDAASESYYAAPPPRIVREQLSPDDEKFWGSLTHLMSLFFVFFPLFTYLLLRDRGPFVRAHTATALNLQITFVIGVLVSWVLTVLLIGFLTLIAVYILVIVFYIIAAVKAHRGEFYKIPVAIPFVK